MDKVEKEKTNVFKLSKICEEFNFQRRRFYDVINVFEVIGCCQHDTVDTITWLGKDNIMKTLQHLAISHGVMNPQVKLKEIIPKEKCDTIGKITQLYIMLFVAMRRQTLNIRHIAIYIARGKNVLKTILCKLYQISFILTAASIIEKTDTPSEIRMCDAYYDYIIQNGERFCKYSVDSLLVKPQIGNEPYIDSRRKEFEKYCKYMVMRTITADQPRNRKKIVV